MSYVLLTEIPSTECFFQRYEFLPSL